MLVHKHFFSKTGVELYLLAGRGKALKTLLHRQSLLQLQCEKMRHERRHGSLPQPLQRCVSASTAVAQVLFVWLHGTSTHFLGEEPLLHLYSLDFSGQHFPPNVFPQFFYNPWATPSLQAISQSNNDSGYKWVYVLCDRPITRFFQQLCRMRGFSGKSLCHVITEIPLLKNSMVGVIFTFTFECESTVYCKRKNKTI